MNLTLKALLAAGLIGIAGFGAVSCSTSSDDGDKFSPAPSEQPAPETPEVEEPEEPADSGDTEEETVTEDTVTFETLGVADFAESLASAKKATSKGEVKEYNVVLVSDETVDLVYREGHFIDALDEDQDGQEDISEHTDETFICYKDNSASIRYYVPKSMESYFDTAIAAYKAAHSE